MQRNGRHCPEFPWICNASIKDKESSNVESLQIAWVYGRVQGVGFRYTTQYERKDWV